MKTDLKRIARIFKFLQDIFFKIMFEGIKIVTTLEYVRGFVPKGWTNVRQSMLTVISLLKWTF